VLVLLKSWLSIKKKAPKTTQKKWLLGASMGLDIQSVNWDQINAQIQTWGSNSTAVLSCASVDLDTVSLCHKNRNWNFKSGGDFGRL
jgi:hypothetical protein